MIHLIALVLAYLAGSVPFGFLVASLRGIDIRTAGSGNIGATNVSRQLGRKAGVIVFLLDFAKGAFPVLVAQFLTRDDSIAVLAAVGAMLGHMFPVWLRLRGGKGVATGAGVVFVLLPIPAAIGLAIWLATLSTWHYVSLASILSAIAVAVMRLVLTPQPMAEGHRTLTVFSLLAVLLVAIRHAGNVARLARGTEHRVSESAVNSMGKMIHVLAMGLWFGANVFFTFVAAVMIFKTWETYGEMSLNDRPTWLPLGNGFTRDAGTRIAGATVGPIFPFFFLIQGVCALLALVTALGFSKQEPYRRVHRIRFWVLLIAALTVAGGWPLSQRVAELRAQRYHLDKSIAEPANAEFKKLHLYSLFLNFGTVGLCGVAMAMAGFLPPGAPSGDRPIV